MRILDDASDKKLDSVILFFTRSELQQLIEITTELLKKPSADHHHLSTEDYHKEITICIYDPKNPENFSPRMQKLIREDK